MRSMMTGCLRTARAGLLAMWVALALTPMSAALGQDAADDRSEAFVAVEGPQQEDVPGGPLLVGAYALLWLLLLGYVWRLGRMHASTAHEVARLREQVQRGD